MQKWNRIELSFVPSVPSFRGRFSGTTLFGNTREAEENSCCLLGRCLLFDTEDSLNIQLDFICFVAKLFVMSPDGFIGTWEDAVRREICAVIHQRV